VDECKPLGAGGRRQRRPLTASRAHGRAVQVDPINSTFKAPGTNRLKLEFDDLLSSFAFNFNLRRYTMAACLDTLLRDGLEAGAYTRPLLSST